MPKTVRHLAFEGGGVKCAAYAGAVKVLDQHSLLSQVEKVAGTSAGAITACILACGGGSNGLMDSVLRTDFSQFIQGTWGILGDAGRFLFQYGIYNGDQFAALMREQIAKYAGDANVTFKDLAKKAQLNPAVFKRLYVIASNVTLQKPQVFSLETTPDLEVWKAIRASMSIPLLFEPMKIGSSIYVDGGLSWNYPIDLFDHTDLSRAKPHSGKKRIEGTLGFWLEPNQWVKDGIKDWSVPRSQANSLIHYLEALGTFMYENANQQHLHVEDLARTVMINDLGVGAADFTAPSSVIHSLIESGAKATQAFIEAAEENSKYPVSGALVAA